ncbi:hypothetical protein [Paenibacillus alkalitolerans]|uniref:hypothetical protein n=1 Tax=Paenibacillus alkalitolerans TaxID=2799335 RepID=UPI0018F4152D|nr:hypothetical protein [Paenibacillus alkalitolerans]
MEQKKKTSPQQLQISNIAIKGSFLAMSEWELSLSANIRIYKYSTHEKINSYVSRKASSKGRTRFIECASIEAFLTL